MTDRFPTRRAMLGGAASLAAVPALFYGVRSVRATATPLPTLSANIHGRVAPPLDLPDVAVTMQDGTRQSLRSLVRGHATAIQLMFTECTATCPIGAAIFMQVQAMLPDQMQRGIQLLSLDIGPFGNKPSGLTAWLRRFEAGPGWLAAVPAAADLPALQALFGLGEGPSDPHSTRVQIISRTGQLIWVTYELPAAEDVVSLLQRA